MNKKLIPAIVLFAIAAIASISIVTRNKNKYLQVETVDVVLEDFSREVTSNGEIRSVKESRVVSRSNGTVQSVFVKVGDAVRVGDVLVAVNSREMESQVRNAAASLESIKMSVRREIMSLRNSYAQALVTLDQAARDYERTVELHKIGSASDEELRIKKENLSNVERNLVITREQLNLREGKLLSDDRTGPLADDYAVVAASAEVRQAETQLKVLRENLDGYRIKALTSGVVTAVSVQEGGFVSTGMTVAAVYDANNLEIITSIDEVDLSWVHVGQRARITSDSFIGSELTGEVVRIAPVIQRIGDSRVCEIAIKILADEKKIARIGASCSVFIEVEKRTQAPAIPVESYFIKDGKSFVALLSENEDTDTLTVSITEIETGILGVKNVEVKSGLSEGQKIVLRKASSLESEMVVKLGKQK